MSLLKLYGKTTLNIETIYVNYVIIRHYTELLYWQGSIKTHYFNVTFLLDKKSIIMIGLPTDTTKHHNAIRIGLGVVLAIVILFGTNLFNYLRIAATPIKTDCPLFDSKAPHSYSVDNSSVLNILHGKEYREASIAKLSGAIQVDTQIFDNQPDVPDSPETWAKFQNFHDYLEKTFPTVYANLNVDKVNTYALVFHWKGSDESLKPLMLTAHQDVVPVQKETLDDWTYPPFEGHYDGEYIYGRGSTDCKNVLISILETFEYLLSKGFEPKRSLIAAFGFDEEASGVISASALAKFLEKTYGKDSMYAIIDEGPGLSIEPLTQTIVATPGTGEKGYVDILVDLKTPGGHSSIPPDHTSIGIVSELAYIIERDPYAPVFSPKNPTYSYMQCIAAHDPKGKIPKLDKKYIVRAAYDKIANAKVIKMIQENIVTKFLIQTSQAIDIISGGEKANALPETTKMLINHRIAIESTVDEVKQHFVKRVIEVAKRHNLEVVAFGEKVLKNKQNAGTFNITVFSSSLEAAPTTPFGDTVWKYLSGVTRHVFEDLVFPGTEYPIISSPSIMTGNTDTRHYWNLTKNIYRYSPFFAKNFLKDTHVHSVDERLQFDGHLQLNAFFYQYIQAVDTPEADN